jgi:hypothetical protein
MTTENQKASSLSIVSAVTILVAAILACGSPTPTEKPAQVSSSRPTPEPVHEVVCYQGITPGQTTRADVVALLGDPTRTEQDGANEILLYPSPHPMQFNTIVFQDQIVVLMDVIMGDEDAPAFSEIKVLYGEPGQITYTNYIQGSMVYIYPDKGRAFIADENTDIVFTKQCFLPMSLDDYLNTWGKDLPSEDPFIE